MGYWESDGKSDEWYTPAYVFEALGCHFDLDVAHPFGVETHVPATAYLWSDSLDRPWNGFIWMNPPFGGRNALAPWLDKFFRHGNGIALTPDRTSAQWWQEALRKSDAVLFVSGKIKFERPDGTIGKSPSSGTTLFASGATGVRHLMNAERNGLGIVMRKDNDH